MAQIPDAVLSQPYTVDQAEVIRGIPVGDLVSPYETTTPEGLEFPFTLASRFPVPPSGVAFTTEVDALQEEPFAFDSVSGNPIVGALMPESSYLEPTIGQIWPR